MIDLPWHINSQLSSLHGPSSVGVEECKRHRCQCHCLCRHIARARMLCLPSARQTMRLVISKAWRSVTHGVIGMRAQKAEAQAAGRDKEDAVSLTSTTLPKTTSHVPEWLVNNGQGFICRCKMTVAVSQLENQPRLEL